MRRQARWVAVLLAATLLQIGAAGTLLAYRPFDGTDAAVAEPKEIEVELGPIGYRQESGTDTVVAPAVVFNYGIAENWELVFEGQGEHPTSGDSRTSRVVGNGVFLKGLLRSGTLQNLSGPSVATEFGVLLPGVNDEYGTGVSVAWIVSQRWSGLTLHLNGSAAVTRAGNADMFVGGIIEGSAAWTVRPVAELFYEHEFGVSETRSLLIGTIWQAKANRAFDVGLRAATVNDHPVTEFRAGVTFGFAS